MGIYKGIEQVTKSTYDNISSEDKVGTLYFVRDNDDNKTTEIYFGNRQYSLSKNEIIDIINNALGNISTNSSKKIVNFSSTALSMDPNTYYISSTPLSSLTITLNEPTDNTIINEYLLEFTVNSGATINFPSSLKWANGEIPTFENGNTYQISIVNNLAIFASFS